jgi:hypothetical protein
MFFLAVRTHAVTDSKKGQATVSLDGPAIEVHRPAFGG